MLPVHWPFAAPCLNPAGWGGGEGWWGVGRGVQHVHVDALAVHICSCHYWLWHQEHQQQ